MNIVHNSVKRLNHDILTEIMGYVAEQSSDFLFIELYGLKFDNPSLRHFIIRLWNGTKIPVLSPAMRTKLWKACEKAHQSLPYNLRELAYSCNWPLYRQLLDTHTTHRIILTLPVTPREYVYITELLKVHPERIRMLVCLHHTGPRGMELSCAQNADNLVRTFIANIPNATPLLEVIDLSEEASQEQHHGIHFSLPRLRHATLGTNSSWCLYIDAISCPLLTVLSLRFTSDSKALTSLTILNSTGIFDQLDKLSISINHKSEGMLETTPSELRFPALSTLNILMDQSCMTSVLGTFVLPEIKTLGISDFNDHISAAFFRANSMEWCAGVNTLVVHTMRAWPFQLLLMEMVDAFPSISTLRVDAVGCNDAWGFLADKLVGRRGRLTFQTNIYDNTQVDLALRRMEVGGVPFVRLPRPQEPHVRKPIQSAWGSARGWGQS